MDKRKITVLLVDDHRIFAEGVANLLSGEAELEIVGCRFSGESALELLGSTDIDLVLTDIQMPGMSGVELTEKIKEAFPLIKVIGLSMLDNQAVVQELIAAGAEGYLLKDIEKTELLEAIYTVVSGDYYYSTRIAQMLMKDLTGKELLTRREKEIIRLIVREFSNGMIAEHLFISEHTVESHRKNIFRKTNSKTLVGLINYAHEHKLV